MAKVYASARVDSSSSNSASSPQLTPTSSQDRPMVPGLHGLSSRDRELCTLTVPQPSAFEMHPLHGRSRPSTNDPYSPYYQPSRLPHYHQASSFNHPSCYSMGPAYSHSHWASTNPVAPPEFGNRSRHPYSRPRPYSGEPFPYETLLKDLPLPHSSGFYGDPIGMSRPVAHPKTATIGFAESNQAQRVTEDDLIHRLKKAGLTPDQVMTARSALLDTQSKSEPTSGPPLASSRSPPLIIDEDLDSGAPKSPVCNCGPYDGCDCRTGRKWKTASETENQGNWNGQSIREVPNDGWDCTNKVADSHVESSYRPDGGMSSCRLGCQKTLRANNIAVYPSASNPKQEYKRIDVWDSASSASEAPSITPNDNWDSDPAGEAQWSVDEIDGIDETLKFGGGKFNDPHLIKVLISASESRVESYLFVQKTTLEKLLHHRIYQYIRERIMYNEVTWLPLIDTDEAIEALKEILGLLELNGPTKVEVVCRTLAPRLLADMYGIARMFRLELIAEELLSAIFLDWTMDGPMIAVKKIYSTERLDIPVRDMFKARIREAIQPNGEIYRWAASWDDPVANVTKAREVLSSIQIPALKDDVYDILLDKVCSETQATLEQEQYDNAGEPPDVSNDNDDLVQESGEILYENTVDNHDNTADPVCEVFEGFDDTPPRPPTPQEEPQAWATGGSGTHVPW